MNPNCIARRDGADPCEKTISEGVFEQGLHAEVHGALSHVMYAQTSQTNVFNAALIHRTSAVLQKL